MRQRIYVKSRNITPGQTATVHQLHIKHFAGPSLNQTMGEGNIFSLCVSSHLDGGGGTPIQLTREIPPSKVQAGGIPIQLTGGVTPFPGPGGGGTTSSWQGVYPSQAGIPHPSSIPSLPEQHSVYLLRGGWCASCVHSGGLSCLTLNEHVVCAL